MKCTYKITDTERLSSINKTTIDADEIEVDFPGGEMDIDFYRVVDGVVTRKPDAEIATIITARLSRPVQSVTMRQGRLAMLEAGILGAVETAIAGMSGTEGEAARIEWEYAADLRRDHPLVVGLSVSLGLSSAQLDELFTSAAQK